MAVPKPSGNQYENILREKLGDFEPVIRLVTYRGQPQLRVEGGWVGNTIPRWAKANCTKQPKIRSTRLVTFVTFDHPDDAVLCFLATR